MARQQYTPYTKAGGYRPQQVDDRNLARLREESQRQLQGMREIAQAEINNRKEIAQQMKADQAYTKAAEEKNFQIQTDNARREAAGLAAKRQQQMAQYQANAQATENIFRSISNISTTAGKVVDQIQQQQRQENFREGTQKFTEGDSALNQEQKWKVTIDSAALDNSVKAAEANGASKKLTLDLTLQNPAAMLNASEGEISAYFTRDEGYAKTVRQNLIAAEQQVGRPLTHAETVGIIQGTRDQLYNNFNARNLSSKFVAPSLKYADKVDQSILEGVNRREIKERSERIVSTNVAAYLNALPEDRSRVFLTSLQLVSGELGFEKAWDMFRDQAFLARDSKGEFFIPEDEIGNLKFTAPTGKTVTFQEWFGKNRWPELQRERVRLTNQHRQQLIAADNLAFQEEANELFKALGPNPTEEQVRDAIDTLGFKYGKTDPRLVLYEKKYTIEARLRTAEAARIAALPDYEITANDLIALQEVGSASEYAAVKQRYDSYNGKWRSKDAEAAIKRGLNVITGTTALGTSKAAQPGAAPALRYFEAQALKNAKVMEGAMGGALPALEKAVADEAARYLNSYREPTSVYYRKVEKDGSISYPNLPGAQNISAANAALRDISNMRVKVKKAGNAEAALRIPNLVMSDARMDQVAQNYGKPGFRPNAKEMAFKGMTNGMPLHEVYNRAFAAAGRKERFASPLQNVGIKVPTHLQKVLNDPAASLVSKMNAVNVAMGNLEPYRNLAASGRAGSPLQKVFVTDPKDDTARSTGSDFVIQSGKRGARYLFPQQGKILKVVRDRPQEFRLEEGAKQRGYGNYVEVRFATPYGAADFLFSHFDKIGDFKVGQIVPRGAFMGTQGRSGSTTGAHISVDAFNVDSPTANPRARDWFLKTYLQQ